MAGINYGNSFRRTKRDINQSLEGVSYGDIIKKWIVRIKVKGKLSTMGAYNTKDEAEIMYQTLLRKVE